MFSCICTYPPVAVYVKMSNFPFNITTLATQEKRRKNKEIDNNSLLSGDHMVVHVVGCMFLTARDGPSTPLKMDKIKIKNKRSKK